nr:WYL domain-containing protein [Ktedonosporobacter rubrisoli]
MVPRAWQVEVWLETTLAEAQRQTRFPRAFFTEDEGGVLLRMDVEDLPWMVQALAGLDFPFVIKQPPELCAVLSQHAQALLDYARRSERVGTSNSAVQQKEGSEPEL